ncbi:(Fe-S)-binding protein [Chloroflexota bacterium]
MAAQTPFEEAVEIVLEAGGEPLRLCYQCGLCTATCPWNLVRNFGVRGIMLQSQLGLVDFEAREPWVCSTCRACVDRCPRGVEIIDVMRALRRAMVGLGFGHVPESLELVLKSIAGTGNPLGEAKEKRTGWTKGRDIKDFSRDTEFLYVPCCVPAYDPNVQRVAQATSDILSGLKVDFGTIGAEENCCGESVRKAGNEELFTSLAQNNINTFTERGVKKILVSSPHCYHTFKNEYPELGGEFEVTHVVQLLAGLVKRQELTFSKEVKKKVAYHDPCYLGRHGGIYEEPRLVLESIPGLELIELPGSREEGICCGGGGGGIWLETKKGERLSDLRLEQAVAAGADILAVACPYCMLNFDDSRLTADKGDTIEIKDISELVREAI